MSKPPTDSSPPLREPQVALKLALEQSNDVKAKVEAHADELAVAVETVKKGIDAGATRLSARKVLRDSEKVEGKVQEVAGDLHQAIETLGEGVDAQTRAETALAESQEALAGAEAALAESQKGERKAIERALHDATTGLPVRALFDDRLSHGIALAERHDWTLAVMFLDLDKFKAVNDTHGHAAGDRVLKEVARRLTETARDEDTVCRNGGDEFLYLLVNPRGRDDIQRIAILVSKNVARPIAMGDVQLVVPTSIGIALYPDDGKNGEELIQKADKAMYRAKKQGGSGLSWFEAGIPTDANHAPFESLAARMRGTSSPDRPQAQAEDGTRGKLAAADSSVVNDPVPDGGQDGGTPSAG